MWIEIEHRLSFHYDAFIHESQLELRVEPLTTDTQTLHSFVLAVGPSSRVQRYRDSNGNWVHHFGVADHHERIEVIARSLVDTRRSATAWDDVTEPVPAFDTLGPFADFVRFDGPVRHSPFLETFARQIPTPADVSLAAQVRGVGVYVGESLRYEPEVTDWRSSTDDFLEHGAGVCQDFAHLALGCLRLRGIPCRYVSGYLHEDGRETAQSHAWVEIFTQAHGWLAFDPTHRKAPDECYVVVATGRHYNDVPPNRGIFRGNAHERLEARVTTRRAERRDVVGLHEEIASIDLPVFRQLPTRVPGGEGPEKQTQQQQQQQQGLR